MTNHPSPPEQLAWLELSPPPAPAPPAAAGGQPVCPICGWPVEPRADRCANCGHSLAADAAPANILAQLNLQLPPPLITVTPAPENWFDGRAFEPPAMYRLRLQAERLHTTTGFDRLICLDDISVDHYQHQLEAALRALRDMRGRALLADEVGLGKTIEAGIVMKELIERGLVGSALILTPASLTWQWHEEMQAKFHETFTVLEDSQQLAEVTPNGPGRWIISLDRAKGNGWAETLLARSYDLLIIDEAHKLKNHQTQAYKFVNQIRKQYVLLLTATPVHNNLLELYNLVTLLRPGHLGTRAAFRQNFIRRAEPRYGIRTVYSSPQPDGYLSRSRAAREEYRHSHTERWLSQRTEDFSQLDGLRLNKYGQTARAEVHQLLAQGYEVFDFEAIKAGWLGADRFVCRLKLNTDAAGPPPRQTNLQNTAALRQLLREVMIRNRRSRVSVRFPPRRAAVYALNLTPPERRLYNTATDYIRRQLHAADGRSGSQRMSLITLQKQLCSSPQAATRALQNLAGQQPDNAELAEILVLAWGIQQGRKIEAVLQLLADTPGKFLIYTDYLPTLEALASALTDAGHETVVFHGGLSSQERVEAVRRFRHSARVMISTQSGSEGHNLQFCHQLINFDLPWNPMRIEQRVGRLHRLGQTKAVSIFNLSANETIEAYILDLLANKIRMFELVIGELDLILGQFDEQRGFEQRVESAWAASRSEAELRQMLAELEGLLDEAQTNYQAVRDASDEISDVLEAIDEVYAR
ncbi:MAG: RNA polymerase-associated protein RapA [Anaerolineae bacterium]|nr:RNA polymerase-associated protein RapA [Anaerolineae bacterium]